jgi:DNA helicase-2/ATP-dependent DNA helicase PcrA
MPDLLASLNDAQRRAVTTTDGPLLVLAGAGTGKTRVITVRAAHLLAGGVPAEKLLLVTFTNKAAREMQERLRGLAGKAAEGATVGTFHRFCMRLIRAHAAALDLPTNFGICDASDQVSALKGVLRELRIAETALDPRAALSRISLFKNALVSPDEAMDQAGDDRGLLVAKAYQRYEEHLRRHRMLDFDDFLVFALRLLESDEALRREVAGRYSHVMVDEYQDTNAPQYRILRALVKDHRNLCVVGDDDQSIYAWRGADVRRILDFEKDFPGAEQVRLETNYRSTEEILEAANQVIRHNPKRHDKSLRSALGSGSTVAVMGMEDEDHEASFVAGEVKYLVETQDERYGDFAILCRTGQQPRAFEAELRTAGIPYRLVGGTSFFDRKEVRDLLAYLRLLANPADEGAFLRIANVPPRGIGKGTLDKVVAAATERGQGAWPVFHELVDAGEVGGSPARGFHALRDILNRAHAVSREEDLPTLVQEVLRLSGYREEIERIYPDPETRELRWNGVMEVVDFAASFRRKKPEGDLAAFLQELSLDQERDEEEDAGDQVTLMTLHAAKGLEFRRVYLVGLEEGILPHRRAAAEGGVEEERRLMYVGVTRARQDLTITFCAARTRFGKLTPSHPSRFLFELKEKTPPDGWMAIDAPV